MSSFYCDGPSPPRVVRCNIQECPRYDWKIRKETKCSHACGDGYIVRYVMCVNKITGDEAHQSNCRFEDKPPKKIRCMVKKCDEYAYKTRGWAPCSRTCGKGVQVEKVWCTRTSDGMVVNERHCNQVVKPTVGRRLCVEKKCVEYKVQYSAWGPCDKPCGTQRRTSICIETYSRSVVAMRHCTAAGKDASRTSRHCSRTCVKKADTLTCDFDSRSWCAWKNVQNDDFDWSLGKRTPSFFTGPDQDHTTKKGYFAYIEASAPRRKGDRAKLMSEVTYIPTGCFTFWYHMKGVDIGHLLVRLTSLNSSEVIFERHGQQAVEKWYQGRITFKKAGNYRISFEGVCGVGVYSDIAIDDIRFYEKACTLKKKSSPPSRRPCREKSPYCKHKNRRHYCKVSRPYRTLCCRTCRSFV